MDNKDVTARTLPHSSRSNHHRSAAIALVVAVVALILGGCDGGESPQGPYQPGVYDGGGYVPDDGYSEYDGGNNPNRFDPKPPEGPFSP